MEAEEGFQTFCYNNCCFAVPEGFKFPTRPKLQEALHFWLLGQVVSEDGQRKVRPFRKIQQKALPENLKSKFKFNWVQICKYLEDSRGNLNLPNKTVVNDTGRN
jgi:hypothetical protein